MAAVPRAVRPVLLSLALILLAACSSQAPQQLQAESAEVVAEVREDAADIVAPVVVAAQSEAEAIIVPAVVQLQEAVQSVLPQPDQVEPIDRISTAGVALIVRWEIGSAAQYIRRYQRPVWPGGASGATIGIGDDLGHQTRHTIRASWEEHAQLDRLLPAAGIVGAPARSLVRTMQDVVTPYALAEDVFSAAVLPRYYAQARRTFADGWEGLAQPARDTLAATVFNRGASMSGQRRAEMRALRDVCVPDHDYACMAAQYRSMCRLWVGTPNERGLCARYEAAASMVEALA